MCHEQWGHPEKIKMIREKAERYCNKMKTKYDAADEETKNKIFLGGIAAIIGFMLLVLVGLKAAKTKRMHWRWQK